MLIYYSLIALSGFLLGAFLISTLKKFSLSHNLLILKGIPLIGGIGIGASFILVSLFSLAVYKYLPKEIIGIIASSGIMLAFGIIDDWHELSVWAKFLVQIIATTLLIFFGVRTQIVYIGNPLNIIVTFIWVLGITNAFNHLDVMDGVAGVTAIIVSLAFFLISVLNGDTTTAVLSLALAGAVLSFLIYNLPPARIYMGNSGSHFLGFLLAAIAMAISYASLERGAALLVPLLILGFPIFDTTFLILIRMSKRKMPFEKS
jgi:UDP-GlcNAc:undecaprenyl-phosphate GlcNAc-1-phosphate transferase